MAIDEKVIESIRLIKKKREELKSALLYCEDRMIGAGIKKEEGIRVQIGIAQSMLHDIEEALEEIIKVAILLDMETKGLDIRGYLISLGAFKDVPIEEPKE